MFQEFLKYVSCS